MHQLLLYSRPDCHLCEQASALLADVSPAHSARLQEVDIESDIGLLDGYGLRIPVLRAEPSGRELGWPFDEETLKRFLAAD